MTTITKEELESTFTVEQYNSAVSKLTKAFKNNQIIDWNRNGLKEPVHQKGFTLENIPYIDIDKVCQYLKLPDMGTDRLKACEAFAEKYEHYKKIIGHVAQLIFRYDNSITQKMKPLAAVGMNLVLIFHLPNGDKYSVSMSESQETTDPLLNSVLKKIPVSEFVRCYDKKIQCIKIDGSSVIACSIVITEDIDSVIYEEINRHYNLPTVELMSDNDVVILAYRHRILTAAVLKACSNATILAFYYGDQLYTVTEILYANKNF